MIGPYEQASQQKSAKSLGGWIVVATRIERELLKTAYPHKEWAKKVDKMSDSQVIAVVIRLKSQNKL